jgi:hypothetical protein
MRWRKTGDRPRFCIRLAKNKRSRKRILMPRHARIVAAGFPLHAILRGIDRSAIFFDDADYRNYGDTLPFTLIFVVSGHSFAKRADLACLDVALGQVAFQARQTFDRPLSGRPMVWPLVRAAKCSGSSGISKNSAKLSTRSSRGRTVTNPSSSRRKCAGVLDQGQSAGVAARLAFTGFKAR